jgi:hypothetical protein
MPQAGRRGPRTTWRRRVPPSPPPVALSRQLAAHATRPQIAPRGAILAAFLLPPSPLASK